ncbi:hypothetical protein ACL02S_23530 [Nocardia sp. 004]|uniref:hypothetical protein n=1 Tax=Nocardia sp. 004 TaxID=3385978 RepID=UPI0039A14BE4
MTITANDTEFLSAVLAGIDAWLDDDRNLDELGHSRNLIRKRISQLATDSEESPTRPAFVIVHGDPASFEVDEAAFERWIASNEDEVAGHIPGSHHEEPVSDLIALFDAARAADVITGDYRLELLIDAANAPRDPGFTLLLRNRNGEQENIAVTTGFTELIYADSALSTAQAARFHLEHVITVANGLLYLITGDL